MPPSSDTSAKYDKPASSIGDLHIRFIWLYLWLSQVLGGFYRKLLEIAPKCVAIRTWVEIARLLSHNHWPSESTSKRAVTCENKERCTVLVNKSNFERGTLHLTVRRAEHAMMIYVTITLGSRWGRTQLDEPLEDLHTLSSYGPFRN